jgi:ABC-2 type transport system ATP-binding protein
VRVEQLPPRFRDAVAGRRVEVRTTAPMEDLRVLAEWAAVGAVDLPDTEVRRPTLEDVDLELTGALS